MVWDFLVGLGLHLPAVQSVRDFFSGSAKGYWTDPRLVPLPCWLPILEQTKSVFKKSIYIEIYIGEELNLFYRQLAEVTGVAYGILETLEKNLFLKKN